MAKDVIARLKADTSQWDSGMAKATRSLNNFQKQNMSTDAVLKMGIGTLTKFASVAALTGAAVEGFRKYMASTEATADTLAQAQRTLTTVTNEFFRSLNDGSFSSFLGGLDDIISRAQSAYQALDELGSFAVRYNPKNAVDMQQIDALMKQARAAKAKGDTKEAERLLNEAKKLADQAKKNTLAYGEKEAQAGFLTMREKLGKPFEKVSDEQIAWYADPKNWEEVNKRAKDYEAQLKKIDDLTKKAQLGRSDEALKEMRFYGQGGKVNDILKARKELVDEQEKLKKIQEKGIRAQTYLNTRDSGEEGQEFINAHQQIYGRQRAQFASDAIQARIDRQDAMTTTGGKTPKTPKATKPDEIIPEGSIAEAEAKIKSLQDAWRNATTQDARNNFAEQLKEANTQLDIMKGKVQEAKAPEMVQGQSFGLSTAGTSGYISMMQQELAQADFGTPVFESLQANLQDASALSAIMQTLIENGVQNADLTATMEELWNKILGTDGDALSALDWTALQDAINEAIAGLEIEPIKLDINTGSITKATKETKGMTAATREAFNAVNTLGGAMQQIKNPAVNIAGTIAQAIANVALAYGDTMAKDQASKSNIFSFIAAAAAATVSMVTTIAAIKQNAKFADGGMVGVVPGSSYVGDKVPSLLNAGEIVLSASMQQNLADNLEARNTTSGGGNSTISGEQIVTVINAYGRRTGRGEILR